MKRKLDLKDVEAYCADKGWKISRTTNCRCKCEVYTDIDTISGIDGTLELGCVNCAKICVNCHEPSKCYYGIGCTECYDCEMCEDKRCTVTERCEITVASMGYPTMKKV